MLISSFAVPDSNFKFLVDRAAVQKGFASEYGAVAVLLNDHIIPFFFRKQPECGSAYGRIRIQMVILEGIALSGTKM